MALPIVGAVTSLAPHLFNLVNSLFTSDEEREKAKLKLLEMEQRGELAQLQINLQEAAHESVFVAGWRPFIGWTCGAGIFYSFVLQPFLVFAINAAAVWTDVPMINPAMLPELDWPMLMSLVGGMLGLGAFRSYEKKNGVNKNR